MSCSHLRRATLRAFFSQSLRHVVAVFVVVVVVVVVRFLCDCTEKAMPVQHQADAASRFIRYASQ